MGSILSAIDDDIDEYESLCRYFGEEVRTMQTHQGMYVPDSYGAHAELLKRCRREGITPTKIRAQNTKRKDVLAKIKPTGRWKLWQQDDDTWYAVDSKRQTEWHEWREISEEDKSNTLPSFVRRIKDIDHFVFTDKTL